LTRISGQDNPDFNPEAVSESFPTASADLRREAHDKDSSALVARRDKFIVDKFSYKHHRP
jgi:hypothetical protein